jgi:HSP20 family protein
MTMYIWSFVDELERSIAGPSGWPQFDIEDRDEETLVFADVPGMRDDEIDVTVESSHLIVRGERKPSEDQPVRRRSYGAFERRFYIGDGYDLDRIQASLADGVLTIRLAKVERTKPRRIKLASGVLDKVKGLLRGEKDPDNHHAA